MSKHGTFAAYPARSLAAAEAALLTVWPTLARYHDDLALVGGLAVHYHTRGGRSAWPGAVTLDVDFGITLSASGGQYGTIRSDLAGLGFAEEGIRQARDFGGQRVYLDFLTEDPPAGAGTRIVDDVAAGIFAGINRALGDRRMIEVSGCDLYGAAQSCRVAVAGIGPLLVLKLNAFAGRRHPKDAYDVLLAVTAYDEGAAAAVAAFRAEAVDNSAFASALRTLRADFRTTDADGPVRAAEFLRGTVADSERAREELVTTARFLLGD